MVNNTLKAVIAATLIFGIGVLTGAYLVEPKVPARPDTPLSMNDEKRAVFLNKLDRQLTLEETQKDRIIEILAQSNERTKEFWEPIANRMRAEITSVRAEIRAELTPLQLEKFDEKISLPRRLNQLPRPVKAEGEYLELPPQKMSPREIAAEKNAANLRRDALRRAAARRADRMKGAGKKKRYPEMRRLEPKKPADTKQPASKLAPKPPPEEKEKKKPDPTRSIRSLRSIQ